MKIDRFDHIHVVVKDIDSAAKFFGELFNTTFEDFGTNEEFGVRSVGSPIGLTLAAPTRPDSPLARYIERRGEGIYSIAVRVPDIDKAIDEMSSRGIRMVSRIEKGEHKGAEFHPRDTYGVMIEIEQY